MSQQLPVPRRDPTANQAIANIVADARRRQTARKSRAHPIVIVIDGDDIEEVDVGFSHGSITIPIQNGRPQRVDTCDQRKIFQSKT